MFLAELLKSSYVVDREPHADEITLLMAGCRVGVDYNMLITCADYEDLLVRYRAAEPASEVILMTIRSARGKESPLWDCLLQNETISAYYSKLCNEYHATMLSNMAKVTEHRQESRLSEQIPTPPKEEETTSVAVMEPTKVSLSKDQISSINTAQPLNISQDSESLEENRSEDKEASMHVLPSKVDQNITPLVETPRAYMEENSNDVPDNSDDEDDYIPKSIRPEVEDAKEVAAIAARTMDERVAECKIAEEEAERQRKESQELQALRDKTLQICSEFITALRTYGIDNVCAQVNTSFHMLVLQLVTVSPSVKKLYQSQKLGNPVSSTMQVLMLIMDALGGDIDEIFRNHTGETRVRKLNNILSPIIKILYEE